MTKELEELKSQVLRLFGKTLCTPRDYVALHNAIWEQTHKTLSTTTLKRIFGYLSEDVHPRIYTLDVLAEYVGARNFEDFAKRRRLFSLRNRLSEDEKRPLSAKEVEVSWAGGDKRCILRHLGQGKFKIVEVNGMLLHEGETVECYVFESPNMQPVSNVLFSDNIPTAQNDPRSWVMVARIESKDDKTEL